MQSQSRYLHSQKRYVALEERLHELPPPDQRVGVAARRIGARQASAQPMTIERSCPQVGQAEPIEQHRFNAPGQRLGRLPEQLRRCTSQNQEP